MQPKVLLIGIDCQEERLKAKIGEIDYDYLETESILLEREGIKGVLQAILHTECPYISFCESDMISEPVKIGKMVEFLERNRGYGAVFCLGRYRDADGHIAFQIQDGWISDMENNMMEQGFSDSFALFDFALHWEENILGSLENCMIRRDAYINKEFLLGSFPIKRAEERMILLLENLYGMKMGIISEALVYSWEKPLDIIKLYDDYLCQQDLRDKVMKDIRKTNYPVRKLPSVYRKIVEKHFDRRVMIPEVRKEITLFYTDMSEYNNLRLIGEEAEKRGYKVEFTRELDKSAEIGIYCSHVNIIKNKGNEAKFSIILLHDLTQGEVKWPNLWNDEPWNSFDIGILPGRGWSERWKRCSGFCYAHPRLGVYELGYPKGDRIAGREFQRYVEEFRTKMGLKYQYSVLYAPAWENDGKEDEFIKALQGLKVNLLVKQADWNQCDSDILENIREMRRLHEGKYDNVYYIEPKEDIFTALGMCDLVVSDESSVMTEALLFGKPSIAVMDWTIPREGNRRSEVSVDYVYKCNKAQLGECVKELVDRIKAGEKTDRADEVFSNVGKSVSDIMDLIEYYTGRKKECGCLDKEIYPTHMLHGLWDA